jgi:hypothetical protein
MNNLNEPDFSKFDIPIPDSIAFQTNENKLVLYNYLSQLSPSDKIVYKIAFDHLGTSFNIMKSNGFKSWFNKQL